MSLKRLRNADRSPSTRRCRPGIQNPTPSPKPTKRKRLGAIRALFLLAVAGLSLATLIIAFWKHPTATVTPPILAVTQQALSSPLSKPGVLTELHALASLPEDQAVQELVSFKPHRQDTSRLNAISTSSTVFAPPPPPISPQTQLAIEHSLLTLPRQPVDAKAALLNTMSRSQASRAVGLLEQAKNFRAAARLAQALLETEPEGEGRDILSLITARGLWLGRAGKNTTYPEFLQRALASDNSDIVAQAALWQEATTQPASFEALALSFQIWETVHLDLSYREKSGQISNVVANYGPGVFEAVQSGNLAQDQKQYQLGRIASIVAEAAFQHHRREVLAWAKSAVQNLTRANPEDKLAPAYFDAYDLYSKNQYADALDGFQSVFLRAYL